MKKKKKVIGLIPCRLKSTRLKNKALLNIDGLPLIVHTFKRAAMCKDLHEVIVCTDSNKIKKVVEQNGGKCLMTSKKHKTGTDRIAEASRKLKFDVAIDIQGDFPFVEPKNISKLIRFHLKKNFEIVVPNSPISYQDAKSREVVKLMVNPKGRVLNFSRSVIPYPYNKRKKKYLKHMSIISFNKKALDIFLRLPLGENEQFEGVELMRALENDIRIGSFTINKDIFSVDIKKDYIKSIQLMPYDSLRKKY